jgi:DNA-binding NtrC family response regulator
MARILVADDHENTCITLGTILRNEGHDVKAVRSGRAAIQQVEHGTFDIVLTDLKLGDIDGIKVLGVIRELSPGTPVVLMTAFGTIDSTVKAMKLGATDYLTKPIRGSQILAVVNNILAKTDRSVRKSSEVSNGDEDDKLPVMIGQHPTILAVSRVIKEMSRVDVPVLILGESGTGKELVAKSIHKMSQRHAKPYVAINCATLPDNLQESELFGHVKGAFTGAVENKTGLFEEANGGTILLDEVGEMNMGTQAKLLRVLEDGEVRRVGGSGISRVDTRVLSSTNENLSNLIKANRFREDLFFRLNVISILLPPLRERMSDLPELVMYFILKFGSKYNRSVTGISPQALERLKKYDWPGNIRELENTLKGAVILSKSNIIEPGDLGQIEKAHTDRTASNSIVDAEKRLILQTLEETRWNNNMTAMKLGMSLTTLWRRMKKFGLKDPSR